MVEVNIKGGKSMSKTLSEVISGIENSKTSISNSLTDLGVQNMEEASLEDMADVISNLGMVVTDISQGTTVLEDGVAVTPVTFTLFNGQQKVIRIKGGFAPYVVSISSANWTTDSTNGYKYVISATTHGRGTHPTVLTYTNGEQTYDSPYIDSSGNITLYSGTNGAMTVVVKA